MLSYYYQPEAVEAMLKCTDNGVVVAPTGSGKSHILRGYVEKATGSTLILTHSKELVEQDFNRLAGLPDIGVWSAGLGVKKIGRITVAGIQSVHRVPEKFMHFDRVLVDEAHLVSNEGMYKDFLTKLGKQYLGLTATDFRLKGGYIHGPGGMFDSVCYEASVATLTEQGYLCPLIYYGDKDSLDTKGIRITGGDFNLKDMSLKFNRDAITAQIAERIVSNNDRDHILVFCIDIEHAENLAAMMTDLGMPTEAVHSKSPRDETLRRFKAGKIRAVTNVNVLTTGFDFPAIDMIAIVRPTKSMGLHQQMLGRGMRTHPSKHNTLIKDYTKNTLSLGTVEDPSPLHIQGKPGKGGDNPFLKECPECFVICHPAVRTCECGHKFKFKHNLEVVAHTRETLPKWYDVSEVFYSVHHKVGRPDSLKAVYRCGVKSFSEYILIEHPGFVGAKARRWISRRLQGMHTPTTAYDLMKVSHLLKKPMRIQVEETGKYPRIKSVI